MRDFAAKFGFEDRDADEVENAGAKGTGEAQAEKLESSGPVRESHALPGAESKSRVRKLF